MILSYFLVPQNNIYKEKRVNFLKRCQVLLVVVTHDSFSLISESLTPCWGKQQCLLDTCCSASQLKYTI